jgi:hypothetical protein
MDIEKLKALALAPAERVEACIADVMARFPADCKDYYVEVHQHLAPLARELERQNDRIRAELQAALDAATRQNIAATKVWQERDELRAEVERLRADAERYRWLCANNFDSQGFTQIHTFVHTWEPHSQTGEPTEWKQRVRGGALDPIIDREIEKGEQS